MGVLALDNTCVGRALSGRLSYGGARSFLSRHLTTDGRFYALFNFRLSQMRITAPNVATMISVISPPDE